MKSLKEMNKDSNIHVKIILEDPVVDHLQQHSQLSSRPHLAHHGQVVAGRPGEEAVHGLLPLHWTGYLLRHQPLYVLTVHEPIACHVGMHWDYGVVECYSAEFF